MNIQDKYDPLSLSARVRKKLEEKASGVQQADIGTVSAQQAPQQALPIKKMTHQHQQMQNDFIDMLFAANPQADSGPRAEQAETQSNTSQLQAAQQKVVTQQNNEGQIFQEDKSKPFSFTIQNSQLGALQLSGELKNGAMQVLLEIAAPIDIQQQDILCRLLKSQLSKELGVPLDLKIRQKP